MEDNRSSDGVARAEEGLDRRGTDRVERGDGGSLGQINVKSDFWGQHCLRDSDGDRSAGGARGKSWSNARA